VELASRYFGPLEPGSGVPEFTSPDPKAPIILKNKRSLAQVHLCLGMPCYPTAHPLRFAAYTLNVMLGGGMSSRLFQNIRERQGLAYAIFSELNMYRDAGCMAVYAGTSLQHLPKMIDSILAEFRSLKNDPISHEELRRAKDHMKGSLLLSLESTSSRMGNLARQWMNFGRFFTLDELADSIERVTAEEVQAVAREFLAADKISAILLGKLEGYKLDRDSLVC
jgi:predicted Zn-dependent peptidase